MCEKLIIQSPLNLNLKDLTDLCLLKEQHWPIGLKKQFGLWFYISNKNDKLIYIEKKQLKIAFLRLKLRRDQKEFYLNLGWIYIKQIFTKETLNANIQKVSNEKACLFYNLEYQREKITLIGKIF